MYKSVCPVHGKYCELIGSIRQPHQIPPVCPIFALCREVKTDAAWSGKESGAGDGAGDGAGAGAGATDSTQRSYPSEI